MGKPVVNHLWPGDAIWTDPGHEDIIDMKTFLALLALYEGIHH